MYVHPAYVPVLWRELNSWKLSLPSPTLAEKERHLLSHMIKDVFFYCIANSLYLQQNRLYPTIRNMTAITTIGNDFGRISTQVMPTPIQNIIRPHNRFILSSFKGKILCYILCGQNNSMLILLPSPYRDSQVHPPPF